MNNTETYTLAELLEDDYFVSSFHHPTAESQAYWASMIEQGKVKREDFELAQYYISNLSANSQSLTEEEISGIWKTIYSEGQRQQQQNQRKKRIRRLNIYSLAAACILLLIGFFIIQQYQTPDTETTISAIDIAQVERPDYDGNDIRIVLSDDNHIVVEENNSEIIYNDQGEARVNSNVVKEAAGGGKQTQTGKFNQVIIPRGKFSSLTLSDGSKLWLNASSRVVYPPVFAQHTREIFIEGEAYIEVTHDNNRPFVVKTNRMEVEVLGTAFNVSAYENEEAQSVVLVSGSVAVKPTATENKEKTEKVIISPSQMFRLSGQGTQVSTVNVNKYISWKKGYFWLESEPMSNVLSRLSNYYGIEINYDEKVGLMRYSGKLDLKDSLDRVLIGLEKTEAIRFEKRGSIYYMSYKP